MIKHEEVREMVIWGRIIHQDTEKARGTLLDYITEQEKKDELLGLYREKEKLAHNPYNNTTNEIRPFYEWACELSSLETKIQELEEEMK